MKHLLAFTLIALLGTSTLFAQHKMKPNSERASPHDTLKTKDIVITYGRPYKKGREIFGTLVPFGQVWRVGADEATQITFKKACTFGDKKIKAGTYTLFATPGTMDWTVILNSKLGQWGSFSYDKVKDKDVLETKVPVDHTNAVTEQFTITVSGNNVVMSWDRTRIAVPVKF